jgi:rhodanese-related sulfurtransferase
MLVVMAKSLHDYVQAALEVVQEVDFDELPRLTDYWVMDVREQDEYAEGHIPGARNYPRGFLEVRADLEHYKRDPALADRSQKIVLYCGGGHRSALAAKVLVEMGFTDVLSLKGGWTEYTSRGLPVEK